MTGQTSSSSTFDSDDWYWVKDEAAARFLLNPATRPFYTIFLKQPVDLHDAAAQLGIKRTTLRYHVLRLIQWNLLAPLAASSGRSRQRYQAVHPQLYLPFQLSGYATLEEQFLQMHTPLLEAFMTQLVRSGQREGLAPQQGGIVLRGESVDFTLTAPPRLTSQEAIDVHLWNSWTTLPLTPEQAQALKNELEEVWQRYRQQADWRPGTRDYTLLLGLAPDQE